MVQAFDSNNDGKVSYLEFCHVLANGLDVPMQYKEAPRVSKRYVDLNDTPMHICIYNVLSCLSVTFTMSPMSFSCRATAPEAPTDDEIALSTLLSELCKYAL